jgi:predicted metalloprotease with PDZ domain
MFNRRGLTSRNGREVGGRLSAFLLSFTFALTSFICAAREAHGQSLDVKIKVVSASPPRLRVEGKRDGGATAWSLRNFYGSAAGLAERVEGFALFDEGGAVVNVKKLASGEFSVERPASRFAYEMKLEPPAFISDSSHVSWMTSDHGLLMLADLLPLPLTNAKVELLLPDGWKVSTAEASGTSNVFDVPDAERAVFAVGRDLRERRGRSGGTNFTVATTGEWAFSDAEAADSVEEILKLHQETAGGSALKRALVVMLPLPQQGAAGNLWSAETRGATVVLVSGRLPSKLAARAQLDGSLTHELFHLWVPNGLRLGGEYGWFYEGFTNYVALRAGMRRGQLTFNDYLNALGRAYDSYRAARGTKEVSLLEASQRRWSGSAALVYHKGMLVAFLYDLSLMRQTRGKSSLDAVYAELFRRYGRGERREDGDRAVSEILGGMSGMRDFVGRFVESAEEITLPALLGPFGLEVKPGGARTHVGVADSLEPAQRELLRKLGYNEGRDADSRKLHERLKERAPR